jgi:hypothetical protein
VEDRAVLLFYVGDKHARGRRFGLPQLVRCGTEHVTGATVAAEARRRAVGVHY